MDTRHVIDPEHAVLSRRCQTHRAIQSCPEQANPDRKLVHGCQGLERGVESDCSWVPGLFGVMKMF